MKKLTQLSDILAEIRKFKQELESMGRENKQRGQYNFDNREPRPEKIKLSPEDVAALYNELDISVVLPDIASELTEDISYSASTPYKTGNKFAEALYAPLDPEIINTVEYNPKYTKGFCDESAGKVFVLDSNILINDPRCIFGFSPHNVVIPIVVLEEIDRFKNEKSSRSASARAVSRELDKVRKLGDLHTGVQLETGGTLRIECNCPEPKFTHLPGKTYADNVILETIRVLCEDRPNQQFILVTEDINLRIRAASMGIEVQEYQNTKVADVGFYDDVPEIETNNYFIDQVYDIGVSNVLEFDTGLQNNSYAILKGETGSSALVRVVVDPDGGQSYVKPVRPGPVYGLKALNKEQSFALDALLDPNIHLVVLTGFSGTGKSLLGMASGLEQVVNRKEYQKLVLARPLVGMGNELGFTPGSLEEKLGVWMVPLMDSFQVLTSDKKKVDSRMRGKNGFEELQALGLVEVESLHHIRGRSMPDIYFQIDEAQNLSVEEMKTILTRAGKGSKIVLSGDVSQIDSPYLTPDSCGLSHVIEKFKGNDIFAHVHFTKGHRSQLADLASNLL